MNSQSPIPLMASESLRSTKSSDAAHQGLQDDNGRHQNGIFGSSTSRRSAFSPAIASTGSHPVPVYGDGRLAALSQTKNTATDDELMSTDTMPSAAMMPQDPDLSVDMNDQDWLFDPLIALDFSKFAQAGSAESSMGFSFY